MCQVGAVWADWMNSKPPMEQPDQDTKVATLNGSETGWDYRFDPGLLPPQAHMIGPTGWSAQNWIAFIGDHWFRKPTNSRDT